MAIVLPTVLITIALLIITGMQLFQKVEKQTKTLYQTIVEDEQNVDILNEVYLLKAIHDGLKK